MDLSPTDAASTAARPRPVRRRRRVWPWVVGGIVVLLVAVVAVPALLMPRSPASSGYLTADVATRSVIRTAQGTGSVVDARVVSIAADDSWAVSSVAGVDTDAVLQTASVTVDKVLVAVGDTVEKGDELAVVTDATDDETTIKAPRDGVIRSVSAYRGATASGILFTLSTSGVRITADISEYDIAAVGPGQAVTFAVDGLGAEAEGTVESIGSVRADPGQTTTAAVTEFPVVAKLASAPAGLRVGMSVQTTIDVHRVDDVLAVPVQALDEASDGTYTVTTVDARGTTKTVDVQVGLIGDSYAEITNGLSAGDVVVIGTAAAGSTVITPGFPGQSTGARG